MIWQVNLMLSLPDFNGFHERLYITVTSKGTTTYPVETRLGSTPLTPAMVEGAVAQAAKSLDPLAISARKEMAARR